MVVSDGDGGAPGQWAARAGRVREREMRKGENEREREVGRQ